MRSCRLSPCGTNACASSNPEATSDYLPLTVARINRQRDPAQSIRDTGEDLGLLAHLDDDGDAA